MLRVLGHGNHRPVEFAQWAGENVVEPVVVAFVDFQRGRDAV